MGRSWRFVATALAFGLFGIAAVVVNVLYFVPVRLLVPQGGAEQQQIRLSHRELEVLRWTMAGKTAWEVGVILGINEQTVVRHLGHAAQKLGCVNKVQAVAKALLMGLIA